MRAGIIALASIVFLAGLAAGIVLTGHLQTQSVSEALPLSETMAPERAQPPTGVQQPRLGIASVLPDFSDVAEETVAAVTNISSRQVVQRRSPFNNDPFFRYFFGDAPGLSGYRERPSLGSGVIVRPDGYILTNAHVVGRNSRGITVTLADERELEAVLVGRDESTDIALLHVDAEGLPTVPWGDSSTLRIAEWVLAIGNPFQLNQTVTLGIVSAVGRDNLGVARYEDFIQTDAAINPGNSGGALINAAGELVGVNTAIFSDTGGYQGVGFAVPSNLARGVMQDYIDYGEVRRGSLGYIDVRALTPQLARELQAPNTRGVVVWRIDTQSAVSRAGLEPGDIIIAFDDQPIDDAADYARLLSDAEINSRITLKILRSGERLELEVTISQALPPRR